MYRPFAQDYTPHVTLLVRAAGLPASTLPTITRVVRGLDPGLAVFNASSLTDATALSLLPTRIAGDLLGALGLLARAGGARDLRRAVRRRAVADARDWRSRGDRRNTAERCQHGGPSGDDVDGCRHGAGARCGDGRDEIPRRVPVWNQSDGSVVFGGVLLLLSLVAFTAALVPALRASRLDPIAALRNN